nr:venom protein 302-like [Penaeus vannamei]
MKRFLCLVVGFALCVCRVTSLTCPEEGPGHCSQVDLSKMKCSVGVDVDYCGYCVCAKGLGEICAGPWNIYGTCGRGLRCNNDARDFNGSGKCVPLPKQAQRKAPYG